MIAQAEDIAYGVLYLASNESAFVTGSELVIDGDWTAQSLLFTAWTIPRGTSALNAAGVIHSDLARGFIRAEVIPYDDLMASGLTGKG